MKAISTTVTAGHGSEKHNHDLEYRSTLKHVHEREDGVIELVDYRPYKEQINELMKPYIDDYNARVDEHYSEAWEKYKSGVRKSKPKRKEYRHMDYDYYEAHKEDKIFNPHTNDYHFVYPFRSLIIGLGDKSDRHTGVISEEQAIIVCQETIADFRKRFPHFHILGATLHLDEEGFYHMHLDYMPLVDVGYEKGLRCSRSQDVVLEMMGYEPEQSIINGRDKVPIRFNAMRNEIYHIVERNLNDVGLRLQYGVSETKEPSKDSSTNQRMEDWQATQDGVIALQGLKNNMLDIIEGDEVSPEGFKAALQAADDVTKVLTTVEQQPRSRVNRDNVVVHFRLFDQLKSVIKRLVDTVAHLLHRIDVQQENLLDACDRIDVLEKEVADKEQTISRYRAESHTLKQKINQLLSAAKETEHRKQFMAQYKIGGVPMEQKFQEHLRNNQKIK